MAKKTIHISDLSGKEVPGGHGATISIKFADARKGTDVLDVTDAEGEELGQKGRKQARRGRRPKEVPTGPKPIQTVGASVAARQRS
jgi:hypothetical protein